MRDYEELVKALRENEEWAEENIWEVPIMLPDNLKQAADAIEELCKPKWISAKEQLPDMKDTDWVIGVVNGHSKNIKYVDAVVMVSCDPTDGGWFLENDPEAPITVTHWMPLPESPKEDGNA